MIVGRATPASVLMVAIGGYGRHYVEALAGEVAAGRAAIAGVVDPMARGSPVWPSLERAGVPAFRTIDDYYGSGRTADLAVIASPTHWHVPQSVTALSHGSHVLCEKPIGATIAEVESLIDARDRTGRLVLIGYQWSFSAAIQALRDDLCSGLFGRPRTLRTLCAWPRTESYYRRNAWAGRVRDPETGRVVLDSPANNAMAHFLHNLFFVLGSGVNAAAEPARVTAECCRAYDIETFDTVAVRAVTGESVELLFYASHVTRDDIAPRFRIECDDAVVVFGEEERHIVATDRRGRVKRYGSPDDTPQFHKLRVAVDAVPLGGLPVCTPEAAAAQTRSIAAIHESAPLATVFPEANCCRDPAADRRFVRGLDDVLRRCYLAGALPSEIGAEWAVPGRTVELAGEGDQPGSRPPGEESR